MSVGDIMKVSGFENIISIEQFEYVGNVNEHEKCCFTCYAKEQDAEALLDLVDSDCTYEDEEFFFLGHISEVVISKDISGSRVDVVSVGKTYIYDVDSHYRVFQNSEKTLTDVLSKLKSMSDVKCDDKKGKVIEGILVQENITDWRFVVYLVESVGEYIFPCEKTFIGSCGSNRVELSEEECVDYKYSVGTDGVKLFCRVNKKFSLGDIVNWRAKELVVCKKKYVLEHGQYYFEYHLFEIRDNKDKCEICNEAFLEAVVKDNDDPDKKGRIKVSFSNEMIEDCMESDAIWLERECFYSTKGFGVVFIPSVGDKVIVKILNGRGIVLGSLRTESFNEVVKNQDSKYIVLDETVFIEYSEGGFHFTNKENTLSLSDEKVTVIIGEKVQLIMDAEKVFVCRDKVAVEISEDLKVSTNKYLIESKNETSISAGNVNIKGKNGVNIN